MDSLECNGSRRYFTLQLLAISSSRYTSMHPPAVRAVRKFMVSLALASSAIGTNIQIMLILGQKVRLQ